jgi:hypothetical protein
MKRFLVIFDNFFGADQRLSTVLLCPCGLLVCIVLCAALFCTKEKQHTAGSRHKNGSAPSHHTVSDTHKKRVLVVNSYHKNFGPNHGFREGVFEELNIVENPDGSLDLSGSPVELHIFYMDTKRHSSTKSVRAAAHEAKQLVERWKPDVVIATEDNAAKYFIVPYYKNTSLPVVFCGVNWDASVYGFPCSNVTGMVEVHLIDQVVDYLRPHSRDSSLVVLSSNTPSAQKSQTYWRELLPDTEEVIFLETFEQFKKTFLRVQKRYGMALIMEITSLKEFDSVRFESFMLDHVSIPTGGISANQSVGVLLTCAQVPEEMGRWAAQTSVRILDGTPVQEIPVTQNRQARVYLNMTMAKKMEILFPEQLLDIARFVEEEPGL